MKKLKDGTFGGPGSRRNFHPKSSGTQGEEAEVKACQDGKINIHFYNVPIKTRFHRSTFLCDIVTEPNQIWASKVMPQIVGEVQGEFHYKTWGGRPAVRQGQKDEVKRNCLIAEGYRYVECTRREVLTGYEEWQRERDKKLGVKRKISRDFPIIAGHILLDRILRAWDDEYWFQSAYYLEATEQRLEELP